MSTGFTYRGLSPHKFTPMPGVHKRIHRIIPAAPSSLWGWPVIQVLYSGIKMKILSLILSTTAVIIAFVWFYFDRSFEPIITGLFGASGIIGTIKFSRKQKNENVFLREFSLIKSKLYAEKNLDSPSYDEAKLLISDFIDLVSSIRASEFGNEYHEEIEKIIISAKKVQNHRIYLGKRCFEQFWESCSKVIEEISVLVERI